MLQLYQKIKQLKVLEFFFKYPYDEFYLRELGRGLDINPMTMKRALDTLVEDNLVLRYQKKNQILYKANIENPTFRYLKISYNLKLIEDMGVIKLIKEKTRGLVSIVLYGSMAEGKDDLSSDVDLLTILPKQKWKPESELKEKLGRDVSVIQMSIPEWTQEAKRNRGLYIDIITNGIVLFGLMPVVE